MVKIKICGIRREEDIEIVNQYLPDYVGFIFFPSSKRYIEPEKAIKLINKLDTKIKKVGVFVNEKPDMVNSIAEKCQLDIVQLHGDEDKSYCDKIKAPYWKAFHVFVDIILQPVDEYKAEAYLFDAYSGKKYGGTGKTFDWQAIKQLSKEKKIILAGGINTENINDAIKVVSPWGIDISSGVETNGYKDKEKVKKVIEMVREGL